MEINIPFLSSHNNALFFQSPSSARPQRLSAVGDAWCMWSLEALKSVVVLEGGYDSEALSASTGATLSALIGESYRPEAASI